MELTAKCWELSADLSLRGGMPTLRKRIGPHMAELILRQDAHALQQKLKINLGAILFNKSHYIISDYFKRILCGEPGCVVLEPNPIRNISHGMTTLGVIGC